MTFSLSSLIVSVLASSLSHNTLVTKETITDPLPFLCNFYRSNPLRTYNASRSLATTGLSLQSSLVYFLPANNTQSFLLNVVLCFTTFSPIIPLLGTVSKMPIFKIRSLLPRPLLTLSLSLHHLLTYICSIPFIFSFSTLGNTFYG